MDNNHHANHNSTTEKASYSPPKDYSPSYLQDDRHSSPGIYGEVPIPNSHLTRHDNLLGIYGELPTSDLHLTRPTNRPSSPKLPGF